MSRKRLKFVTRLSFRKLPIWDNDDTDAFIAALASHIDAIAIKSQRKSDRNFH